MMPENIKIMDVDLKFIKDYLKIDFDDDDILLNTMIISSKSFIQSYLKRTFSDMIKNEEEIPDEFTIACLSIVSHWYENRKIQRDKDTREELSYVFAGLLHMHRNWN